MPFKFVFKNEMHRVPKTPVSYSAFLQVIKQLYGAELPLRFNIQYEDSEGDRIVLASEEDYSAMLETEVNESSKPVKIHISEVSDDTISVIDKSQIQGDSNEEEDVILKRIETSEVIEPPQPEVREVSFHEEPTAPTLEDQEVQRNIFDKWAARLTEEKKHEAEKNECERPFWKCKRTGKGFKSFEEKQARMKLRRETKEMRIKEIAKEAVKEELPVLALLVKELINNGGWADPNTQPLKKESLQKPISEEIPKPAESIENALKEKCQKPLEKPTHRGYTCDVCGMNPIVGNRYKCSVTEDYDLCDDCEALGTHPYPLLKIRNEEQKPYKVITFIDEDELQRLKVQKELEQQRAVAAPAPKEKKMKICKKACGNKKGAKRISDYFKQIKDQIENQFSPLIRGEPQMMAPQDVVPQEQVPVQEKQIPVETKEVELPKVELPKVESLGCELLREINQIPAEVTNKDFMIYKTVVVKNTGIDTWPKGCFLKSVDGLSGEDSALPEVAPGKEFSTVLIIKAPEKAGNFYSQWQLVTKTEGDRFQNIGKPFEIKLTVSESKVQKVPELVPQIKKYSSDITKKAEAILEIFSDKNLNEVCDYIEQVPEKTVDELVEEYLMAM